MAKIGDLSVNIGIEVSDETVQRCCNLLQMYLQDNPDKVVVTRWDQNYNKTEWYPYVFIDQRKSEDKEV